MTPTAKPWPEPPMWMTFNPDAQKNSAADSPNSSTMSLPPVLHPSAPITSVPRQTTEPRFAGSKQVHRAFPYRRNKGKNVVIEQFERLDISSNVAVESAVLSTSSLSEAPGDPANQSSKDKRKKVVSSIELSQLSVDFDDRQHLLGVGTVGSVHTGCYYGDIVAVKRVRMPRPPQELRNDPMTLKKRKGQLRKFAHHVRKYELVQHPSIVRFLGVCIPPDPEHSTALLVMEHKRGGNLAQEIRSLMRQGKTINVPSVVRIALQIVGALRFLHEHDLAWGSIKPENVLLSEHVNPDTGDFPDGAVACISDLGLCTAVSDHLLSESLMSTSTATQPTCGFKSPETFEGVPIDNIQSAKACDIYAVGSLLFFLITQRVPWADMPMISVFNAVMRQKRPEWPKKNEAGFRTDTPLSLKELVEICWVHAPKDRPSAEFVFQKLVKIKDSTLDRSVSGLGDEANGILSSQDGNLEGNLAKKVLSQSSQASSVVPITGDLSSPGAVPSPSSNVAQDGHDEDQVSAAIKQVDSGSLFVSSQDNGVLNGETSPLTSPGIRRKSSNSSVGRKYEFSASRNQKEAEVLGKVMSPVTAPPLRNVAPVLESSNDDAELIESIYKRSLEISGQSDLRLDLPTRAKNTVVQNSELNLFNSDEAVRPKLDDSLLEENYADQLATAAMKFDRKYKSALSEAHPESMPLGSSQDNPQLLSQTMANFNLFESTGPNASATKIALSMKRKRTNQIQAVIERAGAALLELQRREELKGATPPSQKRREAKSKAEEEARNSEVEQAVQRISHLRQELVFSEVLYVMDNHMESELVTKAGLLAIEEAATKDNIYLDVCEESAIEKLHGAMSRFGEDNVELCKSFCRAVSSFSTWRNDKVDHRIRAAGIPSEIMTLMSHHQSDVSLLTAACNSLGLIARSCEPSRQAVATLGGPLAVYRAMTRNLNTYKDVELARTSLMAVRCIASGNEAAAETLVQVSALDVVALTAEVFPNHDLEDDILSALEAFVFYNNGRKALITSKGLHALSALMLRRRDVPFSERCCVFIRSVAQKSETTYEQSLYEKAMLESSIPERAVMTVRLSESYPGDEGGRLAFYASQAVMYLASFGVQTRARLRMVGALKDTIHLLRSRAYNPRVVTMATNALVELMKSDRNSQIEAQELGAVPLLINAAEMYRHELNVYGAVSLTLGFFAGMRTGKIPPNDPLHAYSKFVVRNGAKKKGAARWRIG